jgi:hypothetical protein
MFATCVERSTKFGIEWKRKASQRVAARLVNPSRMKRTVCKWVMDWKMKMISVMPIADAAQEEAEPEARSIDNDVP